VFFLFLLFDAAGDDGGGPRDDETTPTTPNDSAVSGASASDKANTNTCNDWSHRILNSSLLAFLRALDLDGGFCPLPLVFVVPFLLFFGFFSRSAGEVDRRRTQNNDVKDLLVTWPSFFGKRFILLAEVNINTKP